MTRSIIITGASKGIGRDATEALAGSAGESSVSPDTRQRMVPVNS